VTVTPEGDQNGDADYVYDFDRHLDFTWW